MQVFFFGYSYQVPLILHVGLGLRALELLVSGLGLGGLGWVRRKGLDVILFLNCN